MSALPPGHALPKLRTKVPGPQSRALARELSRYESRNITYLAPDWPVFWDRARCANVWDADGNRYIDLTAGFGVASVGHANPHVVKAIQKQAARLPHADLPNVLPFAQLTASTLESQPLPTSGIGKW